MNAKDLLLKYEKARAMLTDKYNDSFIQLEKDFLAELEDLQNRFVNSIEALANDPAEYSPTEPPMLTETPIKTALPDSPKVQAKRGSNNAWNTKR